MRAQGSLKSTGAHARRRCRRTPDRWSVTRTKQKIAAVLVVLAVAFVTAGCLPDNTGAVGPSDPTQDQIFQALNAARAANGRPQFGFSPKLGLDAQIWAAVMSQDTNLRHQTLSALLEKPDHGAYWTLGEDILFGPWYMNGDIIVGLFMNSPPHRANIVSGNFNVVGIGTAFSPDGRLWVSIVFGGV